MNDANRITRLEDDGRDVAVDVARIGVTLESLREDIDDLKADLGQKLDKLGNTVESSMEKLNAAVTSHENRLAKLEGTATSLRAGLTWVVAKGIPVGVAVALSLLAAKAAAVPFVDSLGLILKALGVG